MGIGTPVQIGTGSSASSNTLILTTTADCPAGNQIFIALSSSNGSAASTATIVDTATNTYVDTADGAVQTSSSNLQYVENCLHLASGQTITVTWTGAPVTGLAVAFYVPGMLTSATIDQLGSTAHSASGTSPSSSTGGLSQAAEIAVAFLLTVGATTYTEAGGFTSGATATSGTTKLQVATQIVNATTAITYAPSLSPAVLFAGAVVTFKGTVAPAPFAMADWPNPVGTDTGRVRFPNALRTHVEALKRNLLGQDRMLGGPGEVPAYVWQNPVGTDHFQRRFPVVNRTHADPLKLNLLGQDSFFSGPGRGPAYDYPNPTRLAPASVALRTHTEGLKLALLGQDKFFGAPGEVPRYDYPNPRLNRPQWPDVGQSAAISLLTFVGAAPFLSKDWPNPLRGYAKPTTDIGTPAPLALIVPAAISYLLFAQAAL